MNKIEFESALIGIFPDFKKYWEDEDIFREEDLSFSAHGLMRTFLHFFRIENKNFNEKSLRKISRLIETELLSDPNGMQDMANAIYAEFLELIDNEESRKLDQYLTKSCEEHYKSWVKIR